MGIGITSNWGDAFGCYPEVSVSIPNGDRHYLERGRSLRKLGNAPVSIPNGDRHYLEQLKKLTYLNLYSVSIPNGDRHYLEHRMSSL